MEGTILSLLTRIMNGGTESIIGLLILVIFGLILVVKHMDAKTSKDQEDSTKHQEVDKKTILDIVDKYHDGNLQMVQALNEIKIVLTSIQERVR